VSGVKVLDSGVKLFNWLDPAGAAVEGWDFEDVGQNQIVFVVDIHQFSRDIFYMQAPLLIGLPSDGTAEQNDIFKARIYSPRPTSHNVVGYPSSQGKPHQRNLSFRQRGEQRIAIVKPHFFGFGFVGFPVGKQSYAKLKGG
jgi:hypothetical protein